MLRRAEWAGRRARRRTGAVSRAESIAFFCLGGVCVEERARAPAKWGTRKFARVESSPTAPPLHRFLAACSRRQRGRVVKSLPNKLYPHSDTSKRRRAVRCFDSCPRRRTRALIRAPKAARSLIRCGNNRRRDGPILRLWHPRTAYLLMVLALPWACCYRPELCTAAICARASLLRGQAVLPCPAGALYLSLLFPSR